MSVSGLGRQIRRGRNPALTGRVAHSRCCAWVSRDESVSNSSALAEPGQKPALAATRATTAREGAAVPILVKMVVIEQSFVNATSREVA